MTSAELMHGYLTRAIEIWREVLERREDFKELVIDNEVTRRAF
jgi:hypothetical protein